MVGLRGWVRCWSGVGWGLKLDEVLASEGDARGSFLKRFGQCEKKRGATEHHRE